MTYTSAVIETQLQHRSVRQFTDQPVSQACLQQLIQAGQAAASSSFIQAYSVVQVHNAKTRQHIAKAAGGQAWIEQAPVFLVFCADLYRINHCSQLQDLGTLQGHTEHFIAASVDVALMAQNVMLAAESLGLGGVFIGGIRNDPQLISDLLALPEQVYPVFGMCLGWPNQLNELKPRLPVELVLHQESYQTHQVAEQIAAYDTQMSDYYQQRSQQQRQSTWSSQTASAIQKKLREHMLPFLQKRGFLKR